MTSLEYMKLGRCCNVAGVGVEVEVDVEVAMTRFGFWCCNKQKKSINVCEDLYSKKYASIKFKM